MRSLWSNTVSVGKDKLDLLAYQSRLIGAEPSLVLWGGGNTSLKGTEHDFRGREVDVVRIKVSGADMKTAERLHFAGVRLDDVLPLIHQGDMSDESMVEYLSHCLMESPSPRPSIETLLHAFLPFTSVLHSHADAILSLTNNSRAQEVLDRCWGDAVAVVPYRRPGFLLSKEVAQAAQGRPTLRGVILMNHGLITWGASPQEAYETHIALVSQAEAFIREEAGGRKPFGTLERPALDRARRASVAAAVAPMLRGLVSRNQRAILRFDDSDAVLEFLGSARAPDLSAVGPATPDHLLRTKHVPLHLTVSDPEDTDAFMHALAQSMEEYARAYEDRFHLYAKRGQMMDPFPRVVQVPGVGMWTVGPDALAAVITADVYHHTIAVMAGAQALGDYTSLNRVDAFEAEYWPLELAKQSLAPLEKELSRRVALITGAAGGIGRAIARKLAAEGAHVVLTDLNVEGAHQLADEICQTHGMGRALALHLDVADEQGTAAALRQVRLAYGGLDILVSNAGIASTGMLHELPLERWQRALEVNATGHFLVSREVVRLMREQRMGGSLVFIGTKNVPAPGREFGAYSASKAAAAQLSRVLSLENGDHGIRCNVVNPDAVFEGSGLWSAELRAQRAQAHGVIPGELEDFYRQRNLLKARVSAEDVAEAVAFLAGDRSSKTTGAMLPVDGGLREAFPR